MELFKHQLALKILAVAAAAGMAISVQAQNQQTASPSSTAADTPVAAQTTTTAPGASRWQVTAEQKTAASIAAQQGIHVSELAPNAPVSYRVVPGDTLWGISSVYLKSPWKWPSLWGMNQSQIKNPHLIYPGQVLILVINGDRAMLQIGHQTSGAGSTAKLSPQVRSLPGEGALPVLSPEAVIPFLKHGIVIPRNEFDNLPRVVSLQENRLLTRKGDKVYVRGGDVLSSAVENYAVYTKPEPLRDPVTNDVLGFHAKYLGKVKFNREGSPGDPRQYDELEMATTFIVTDALEEIRVGDYLMPATDETQMVSDFIPHAAPAGMQGRVVHLYSDAVKHTSIYRVVILNKGHMDGLERGHVVALWRPGAVIVDKNAKELKNSTMTTRRHHDYVKTPDERYGLAMVFRTHDHLSYAIVTKTQNTVDLGDNFTTP